MSGHPMVVARLFQDHGVQRAVEVGVERGITALHLLQTVRDLKLTAVDPWAPYDMSDAEHSGGPYGMVSIDTQEAHRAAAMGVLRPYIEAGRCNVMHMTSLEAAGKLRASDAVFDAVWIDADHRRKPVYEDCTAWWPLVRKGGILCGHDLGSWVGVAEGVGDFLDTLPAGAEMHVMPSYVWVIFKPEG